MFFWSVLMEYLFFRLKLFHQSNKMNVKVDNQDDDVNFQVNKKLINVDHFNFFFLSQFTVQSGIKLKRKKFFFFVHLINFSLSLDLMDR